MGFNSRGFFAFLVCMPVQLFAQPGVLKEQLRQRNGADTQTVNLLNRIADAYMQETATDSALTYAGRAGELAKQIGYTRGYADALVAKSKNYYKTGDYEQAANNALQSLRICDSVGYDAGRAMNYNVLGLVYLSQGKNAAAEEQFRRAVLINVKVGEKKRLSSNYFNLALLYTELDKRDSVIHYLSAAGALSKETNNLIMQVMVNNRLGDVFQENDEPDKAIESYRAVLDDTTAGLDWEKSYASTSMALCYLKMNKPADAVKYAEQGTMLARKLKTKWDIARGLGVLHEAYARWGKYDIAYKTLIEQKAYTDSMLSEAKNKDINALHLQQEKAERLELQRQNEAAQHKNMVNRLVMAGVAVIAGFLMVLVIVYYRNNRKKNALNELLLRKTEDIEQQKALIEQQNRELAELNRTKDQLFSIIGHDLRSPFNSITSGLDLVRQGYLDEKEQHYMFEKLYEQTLATSIMVDNLLLWARSQISGIVVRPATVQVPALVDQLTGVLGGVAADKGIKLKHERQEGIAVTADPDHLKIIIQNLLTNAIKFTGNGGSITISYSKENEHIHMLIADTGQGMDDNKLAALFHKMGKDISTRGTNSEVGTGLGLIMVKKFVDENKGQLTVTSTPGKGTVFSVELPAAAV